VLYVAEARGEIVADTDKSACEQIRLTRLVGTFTREIAVTFAADCAERVLPIFEARFPDDDRPRKAIEAARSSDAYANAAAYAANAAAAYAANAAHAAHAAHAAGAYAADAAAYAAYAAAHAADAAYADANAAAYAAAHAAYAAYAADAEERAWQGRHLLRLIEKENAR
jgi:hypothetical protein